MSRPKTGTTVCRPPSSAVSPRLREPARDERQIEAATGQAVGSQPESAQLPANVADNIGELCNYYYSGPRCGNNCDFRIVEAQLSLISCVSAISVVCRKPDLHETAGSILTNNSPPLATKRLTRIQAANDSSLSCLRLWSHTRHRGHHYRQTLCEGDRRERRLKEGDRQFGRVCRNILR